MSEHHLNGAEIGAALEQVRRERVPNRVRAERPRQIAAPRVRFEDLPEPDAAERAAPRVEEQPRRGPFDQSGAPCLLITTHPVGRPLADRDEPLLVPFPDAAAVILV